MSRKLKIHSLSLLLHLISFHLSTRSREEEGRGEDFHDWMPRFSSFVSFSRRRWTSSSSLSVSSWIPLLMSVCLLHLPLTEVPLFLVTSLLVLLLFLYFLLFFLSHDNHLLSVIFSLFFFLNTFDGENISSCDFFPREFLLLMLFSREESFEKRTSKLLIVSKYFSWFEAALNYEDTLSLSVSLLFFNRY